MKTLSEERLSGVITKQFVIETSKGVKLTLEKWWAENEVDWEFDKESEAIYRAMTDEESDEVFEYVSNLRS